jgi:hypothetical protein
VFFDKLYKKQLTILTVIFDANRNVDDNPLFHLSLALQHWTKKHSISQRDDRQLMEQQHICKVPTPVSVSWMCLTFCSYSIFWFRLFLFGWILSISFFMCTLNYKALFFYSLVVAMGWHFMSDYLLTFHAPFYLLWHGYYNFYNWKFFITADVCYDHFIFP